MDTVTINRDDLIAVMALATLVPPASGDDNVATEAWMRCWNALITTPSSAIALHDKITGIVREIQTKKGKWKNGDTLYVSKIVMMLEKGKV